MAEQVGVAIQRGFLEAAGEKKSSRVVTDIPANDEKHAWEIWTAIVGGFDNSPDWDCAESTPGYRTYTKKKFPESYLSVYITHG